MGGFGSGKSYARGREKRGGKTLTSYLYHLDVSDVAKKHNKTPGMYETKLFELSLEDGVLHIKRRDGEGLVTKTIIITTMPCNYGGIRHFGQCPFCSGRVKYLYLCKDVLACRHCLCLSYKSQNETLTRRLLRLMWKVERKIGCGEIKKPKWMRWKTFEKLRQQYFDLDEKSSIADIYSLRTNRAVDKLFTKYGCAFAAADAFEMEFLK